MWSWLASRILRNRVGVLVVLALSTAFMAVQMQGVKKSYKFGGLLPQNDQAYIDYQDFLAEFPEDGNLIVLGVQDQRLYELDNFKAWHQLGLDLKNLDGVDSIFSEAHLFDLKRNDENKSFELEALVPAGISSQGAVDSIIARARSLPFYKGLLYNDDSGVSLMMVFVNADKFNSKERGDMIDQIVAVVDDFTGGEIKVQKSGLPYIRFITTNRIDSELKMFVGATILVTALLLLFFFRSWKVMLFCMLVVSIAVVWALGTIALFDYKLTSVMAIIPPLIIVIGIPNCVFLINKYFHEYVEHNNQIKALSRVIVRIGRAALMTNATTALGFATFVLTYSDVLKQFGVIAALNIMIVFVLSLLLIPILFSYAKPPKARHTKHLNRAWVEKTTDTLVHLVLNYRKAIYTVSIGVFLVGVYGITGLRNEARIADDLPTHDPVMEELAFFEKHFKGVMPLEIVIDTKKKGQALKSSNLKRIARLQDSLATHPELSRSLSIVDAVKFTKQAFYGGRKEKYSLVTSSERSFILPYLEGAGDASGIALAFMDSTRAKTRISVQMADVGTVRMDVIISSIRTQIDSVFPPEKYHVTMTGTSVVFLKGSNYMVRNLGISLGIAIILISILMSLLFRSVRMSFISLIPNLVPLVTTAGLMGYLGIPIKPSTILVFSIAFGISVDDAIHYLAKFRLEMKLSNGELRLSVINAIHEAGLSMIYTSIVLFCGFCVFSLSDFQGIQALGVLISVTLLVAMFTNLLILPSLLLTFEKDLVAKAMQEPMLSIYDEEEDIELDELEIEGRS